MPRFKRSKKNQTGRPDERGVVCVQVLLTRTKGNLSYAVSLEDAKVSEVRDVIEEALFAAPTEEETDG